MPKSSKPKKGSAGGVNWVANNKKSLYPDQRAKKVVSDSPGLMDFAIGLVNSVFTCPTGK